ncbi:MAG: ATP-binding cassette domain-containing protein, partial [Planctomycetales bacterium]
MKQKKNLLTEPLLQVEDLIVEYAAGRNRKVHAVSEVSFDITRGETFGLVGESGCGKSSVAKAIMLLPKPTSGKILLNGVELTELNRQELRLLRQQFQMVFQDPVASLNPRCKIGKSIEVPLRATRTSAKDQRHEQVRKMLESVGLDPEQYHDR